MSGINLRYRILVDDDGNWFVRWLMGSSWVLVHGPGTEASARDWLDAQAAQAIAD